jgi:membrane-associated phospholipid phosphatase
MLNRPNSINLVSLVAGLLLLTPLVVLCVRYLDIPLADLVRHRLFASVQWSGMTSNLPDLLLQGVLAATCAALVLYQVRSRMGIDDPITRLSQLVAWTAPASYLVKSVLKFAFGRVNTRIWLEQPGLYGFHWFQGAQGCEGFPSGHMVVSVTLLAALCRYYPKFRPWCLLLGVLLGVALIATGYHFLSDVIAGAYLGVVIEAVVFGLLVRQSHHPENPAI